MSIITKVKLYNEFQNQFGQNIIDNYDITQLFAKEFSKTANGKILVNNSSELLDQLTQLRNTTGNWTIEEIEVQSFINNESRCLNHYLLHSDNVGSFDVMAIVTIDEDSLITQINENYYHIG